MPARLPLSVLVVVVSDAGETLLLLRRQPAAFWQSVTGSLRRGETPLEAARRELREETGLGADGVLRDTGHEAVFPIAPAWRHRYPRDAVQNREFQFVYRVPVSLPVRLSRCEHVAYAWTSQREAARRVASRTNREALRRL